MHEGGVQRRAHERIAQGGRHLDEIAQHVVVLDLEPLGRGEIAIFLLQGGDDLPALVAERPHLVERGIDTGADEIAIAPLQWRVLDEGRAEPADQVRVWRRDVGSRLGEQRRQGIARKGIVMQQPRDDARCREAVADRGEIAWAGALQSEARMGALEIGCRPQALA